jgi:hypothetical protein
VARLFRAEAVKTARTLRSGRVPANDLSLLWAAVAARCRISDPTAPSDGRRCPGDSSSVSLELDFGTAGRVPNVAPRPSSSCLVVLVQPSRHSPRTETATEWCTSFRERERWPNWCRASRTGCTPASVERGSFGSRNPEPHGQPYPLTRGLPFEANPLYRCGSAMSRAC